MLRKKIETLPSLKEIVDQNGLLAKKSLGQNFLLDSNITDKIIGLSLDLQKKDDFSEDNIIEVGPGPGGLTRSILKKEPKSLTVIEMDDRCIKIMEDIKSLVGDRMDIINGDALRQDFDLVSESPKHIISNLPYNISVPLLISWLKNMDKYESLTLMFQKEVAERIMSETRNKAYGRISILTQNICQVDKLFDINPNCFVPAPKIWSSVLVFRPLKTKISLEQIEKLEKVTNMAFGQRRKMIRHSLKPIENLDEILEKLNIKNSVRAEELTPQDFLNIVDLIKEI